ncbi:MAG TPA: aminoglycoside phosphotransferase family protein [Anaerolineae bacterium]|nr:aminoglycoside phosphotransferase family protein [Anaerolineae bacterium]
MRELLRHLSDLRPPYTEHLWQSWHIRVVPSGNNLIFRATRDADDWAVKFTIRDERNRAQQEYNSLSLLEGLDIPVAPRPIYFDQEQYRLPVVVQTWIDGKPLSTPPEDDVTWSSVVLAYHNVHRVTVEVIQDRRITLPHCSLVTQQPDKAVNGLYEFLAQVPESERPVPLIKLLAELERTSLPPIRVTSCLCHGDATLRNMLWTTDHVALVDWEYSGLCDPAHEVAKIMAHPHAKDVSEDRWQWLTQRYAQITGEDSFCRRIQVQYALALIWWCIRLVYGRSVLLQRPTRRLVGSAPEVEISSAENIERYILRARNQLRSLGTS